MKKFIVAVAALSLVCSAAYSQSLLGKLKQKAENAIGSAISEKLGGKTNESAQPSAAVPEPAQETAKPAQEATAPVTGESKTNVVRPEQQLERRRTSTFGWSEAVTPSTAKNAILLMNEFPAVPSGAELANPTENAMIAYYRAIKKVTMRAEELNADETCMDNFAKEWREKQADKLAAAYGLTRAEWDAYCSGSLTGPARDAIEKKMQNAMFGGVDLEKAAADLEASANKNKNMSEEELEAMMMKKSMEAMMKVYEADPAETKYVTGKTPAELRVIIEEAYKESAAAMAKGKDPGKSKFADEAQAYSQKMKAKDGAAYTRREEALNKKIQEANKKAMMDMDGFGEMSSAMDNLQKFQDKTGMNQMYADEMKFSNAVKPMYEALEAGSDIDARFSAAERSKVEAIKDKIYATNDHTVYNPLYLQALEAIRTYRQRAAALWSTTVQKRFDNVKAQMPSFVKTMREEVEAGYIPECALWRSPLNVVIQAGDILEEAYSEFPCDYPHMYLEEVTRELRLCNSETLWWPEFYVASSVNQVLSANNLFKSDAQGTIYKFNSGKWVQVPESFDPTKLPEVKEPASAVWKSRDGKREVIYNADGHWLQLPEGDVVNPVAIEYTGNEVIWAYYNYIEDGKADSDNGCCKVQIVKCTYKL